MGVEGTSAAAEIEAAGTTGAALGLDTITTQNWAHTGSDDPDSVKSSSWTHVLLLEVGLGDGLLIREDLACTRGA